MDVAEYIASGILELYVAGQLSEKENSEVHALAIKHPEIASEIQAIEAAILTLAKANAPAQKPEFKAIKNLISPKDETSVIPLDNNGSNWTGYLGWAASVLFALGLFWMYNQNNELKSQIEIANQENLELENQIADSDASLEKSQTLLQTIRDKEITVVPLSGQAVSPDSYAKVYWNKKEQKVFIDAVGLPEPPEGMVYQVWSLKMNPLTPTSMGLLEDFSSDENKVFALANPNASEAFGITLEPAGGSASPNLGQLYTLGAIAT
jgi:anti-sigma-K factor RskA